MTHTDWSGPSVTALGLAASRAVESGRPDRLIDDPFARVLFTSAGVELPMRLQWPQDGERVSDAEALHLHGSRYIGLRTRFYDDHLLAAAHDGVRQALLLGAGLDTRAYRLELPPDFTVFELDQPGVLDYKRRVLAADSPRCRHAAIGVDLRHDWRAALRDRGFDPTRSAVWIAEGLLPYLGPDEQVGLLHAITSLSASGSRLAFDHLTGDPVADHRARDLAVRSGIEMDRLFAAGEASDVAGVLAGLGWSAVSEPATAVAKRYGRDLADPFSDRSAGSEPPWLATTFVSATLGG